MVGWWQRAGVVASLGVATCNVDVKAVEYEHPDTPGDDWCHDTSPETGTTPRSCGSPRDDLDILFVVDDSPSMLDEQARIAANFATFVDYIDHEKPDVDFRIGITTTDNSNPWCGGTTTPTAGKLVLSSCRERLDDFVETTQQPPVDATAQGCTDLCPYTGSELDQRMLPTTTDLDPEAAVRPWIERIDGVSNLPEGISPAEALACFGPQGVRGCGFESHLESMHKALARTKNANEASYGFMRDRAQLLVVFITDEADCSYRNELEEIFLPEGNHVFWSDPEKATSGVCWNAGVLCLGGPGQYDDCVAVDRGIDGLVVDDPDLAVLHPVDRYADFLDGLEEQKQQSDPSASVFVSVIGGAPPGYEEGGVPIPFADDPDPELQAQYGIGPACTSEDGAQTARPPVRLRALTNSRGPAGSLISVCADDFSPALAPAIASLYSPPPACYRECVADTDPQAPGLQPACLVEAELIDGTRIELEPCALVDGAWELASAGTDGCYGVRFDAMQAGGDFDDLSNECIERGSNLEFELVFREGVQRRLVTATCEPSTDPELDCPDL